MTRSDIDKFFSLVPKTIYTIKFFKFIEGLKQELKSEHEVVTSFREQIRSSKFAEIESRRTSISNSPEKLKALEEEYSDSWGDYILMIGEVNKFFLEDIKTTSRISLEDVPDEFVETLDEDGVRIFSEFFN